MATDTKKPYGNVAYADPGYQEDGVKRYPLDTEAHCRAAWSYINQSKNAAKYSPEELAKIKGRIKAAGREFGIEFADEDADRSERLDIPYARSWAVDDVHILRAADGYGDGRTVEAYAAVFDSPTEISDQHGHYYERIARTAFNMQLGLGIDRVGVYYHHGMTLHGTPSDLGSVPIGSPVEIRADAKGLRTITRFNTSPLAEAVLDAIGHGDIKGYSFRGRIYKSSPSRVPKMSRDGKLSTIIRTEMGLTEYGPTPTPAYVDASILAVRALQVLASTSPRGDQEALPASSDPEPGAAEDQPEEQSTRSHQQRLAFKMRVQEATRRNHGAEAQ